MTAAHNPMNQITTLGYGGRSPVAGSRRCWTAPAKGAFGDRRRRFLGWRLHSQSGVPRQVGVPAALQHHGNTFGGAKWRQITLATAKAMTASHNNMNQITTLGGGGKTRVAGSLDEPGQVSVGSVGQGDERASHPSGAPFRMKFPVALAEGRGTPSSPPASRAKGFGPRGCLGKPDFLRQERAASGMGMENQ